MLIFSDLTTPDLTAKPDLQALFLGPMENLKRSVYNTSHEAPQTSTLTLTNLTIVEAW